jgi:tetratricopeptide (TPR) repeat protein
MEAAMRIRLLPVFVAVLLAPAVSRAEWLEASSTNFVIYADDSERDVLQLAQQLERFHAALGAVLAVRLPQPSPSSRVTIYVVGTEGEVRRLYGGNGSTIAAFYTASAGRSLAIVPKITTGTTELDESMIYLLHEYAHHFTYRVGGSAMPLWYMEGSAEFFASASFFTDGSVGIGQAAKHRADELRYARDVKVSDLIGLTTATDRRNNYDAFYGKSWLLYHYLVFSKERQGQLQRYVQLLSQGKTSMQAAAEAFGDLGKLGGELNAYENRQTMTAMKLPASALSTTGQISVRRLREGEAATMPVHIRSRRGVTREQALALLPEARAVAARFPQEPAALSALAEAEYDAGNDAESIAAADAAIARDPSLVNPYVQKGAALFRQAAGSTDPAAAYGRAMEPFRALNRLEPAHPMPMLYNYLIDAAQNAQPDANALNGLRRAVQVAPFDTDVRLLLAGGLLSHRQFEEARRNLRAVALNPHAGRQAEAAQRVLQHMDANPEWDGKDIEALLKDPAPAKANPVEQRTPQPD